MSQQWDYLVEEIKTADANGISQIINELAGYGWELVSVNPPLHYFKRAKQRQSKEVEGQDEVYGLREA